MRLFPTSMLLLVLFGVGCAETKKAPLTAEEYQEAAEQDYLHAMRAFDARDWENAKVLLGEVRRSYGHSRWARLAELRLAEVSYQQKEYPAAIAALRSFVHDYPNDPEIKQARLLIIRSLSVQLGEAPLMPPEEERDLQVARDAYQELQEYIGAYPGSEEEADFRYQLEVVSGLLARHELYVAHYYLREGRFQAAAYRIETALQDLPASGLEAEALVLLGETYLRMKRRSDALEAFYTVRERYPASPFAKIAERFLAGMGEAPERADG